jgi:hypothetical protein
MVHHAIGQDLYQSKKGKNGQETVKFWMLYQALTTIDPGLGKENHGCRRVTGLPAGVPPVLPVKCLFPARRNP